MRLVDTSGARARLEPAQMMAGCVGDHPAVLRLRCGRLGAHCDPSEVCHGTAHDGNDPTDRDVGELREQVACDLGCEARMFVRGVAV